MMPVSRTLWLLLLLMPLVCEYEGDESWPFDSVGKPFALRVKVPILKSATGGVYWELELEL